MFFRFFKKRKLEEEKKTKLQKKEKEKKEKKIEKKEEQIKEKEREEVLKKEVVDRKRRHNISLNILRSPHITEKATKLEEENKYVFKVDKRANKTEIGKAIEDLYGVKIVSVRIINIPRKKRRLGRTEGFRKGYKKAVVQVKKGQKITVLSK